MTTRNVPAAEAMRYVRTSRVMLADPVSASGLGVRKRRHWAYWQDADGTFRTRAGRLVSADLIDVPGADPIPMFYVDR